MGERNHFIGQQITRSDRSSHKILYSCGEKSFAFKLHFIHTAAPLSVLMKNINHKGHFLFTPMQNSRLIRPIEECFWVKMGRFDPWANRPQRSSTTAYFTAWTSSSFDDAMEKMMLGSQRKL